MNNLYFNDFRKGWEHKFYRITKKGKVRELDPINPSLYGRCLKPWEVAFLEDLKCLSWIGGVNYLCDNNIIPHHLKVINYFDSNDNIVYDALAFRMSDLILKQPNKGPIISKLEPCYAIYQNPGFKIYPMLFFVVVDVVN